MRISALAIAAAALAASAPFALAAQGAKGSAPGQEMLQNGPASGSPGASGYAPGHLKKKGMSAKTYAPGQQVKHRTVSRAVRSTTGATTR